MNFETHATPWGNDKEVMVIEELTVSVVDDGVKLFIKSPLLAEWYKGKNGGLPADWQWPIYDHPDILDPNNLFWLLKENLGEGFTYIFPVPVLVPAELNDYLQTTFQHASKIYYRYINRPEISGSLRVKL